MIGFGLSMPCPWTLIPDWSMGQKVATGPRSLDKSHVGPTASLGPRLYFSWAKWALEPLQCRWPKTKSLQEPSPKCQIQKRCGLYQKKTSKKPQVTSSHPPLLHMQKPQRVEPKFHTNSLETAPTLPNSETAWLDAGLVNEGDSKGDYASVFSPAFVLRIKFLLRKLEKKERKGQETWDVFGKKIRFPPPPRDQKPKKKKNRTLSDS